MLEDLGSTNGTMVTGHIIEQPVTLRDTDEVQVGDDYALDVDKRLMVSDNTYFDTPAQEPVSAPGRCEQATDGRGDAEAVSGSNTLFGRLL